MKSKIEKVANIVKTANLKNAVKSVSNLSDEFCASEFTIMILGEFKAGKSTLINRLFLGENMLFTDVMEATAISTEVKYGEKSTLKVYPIKWDYITNETTNETVRIYAGEEEPLIFANPTSELIKKYTAGETKEDKIVLVDKYSRAELFYPNEILKGLSIVDTPGINSTTDVVLDGVKRQLPKADLILFVKRAKAFSNVELDFLENDVFSKGVCRGEILVNDDPRYASLTVDEKKSIIEELEAQLDQIGRGFLPVEMLDFKNSQSIEDVLFSESDSKDAYSSVAENIIQYINNNKSCGRNIKVKEHLKLVLDLAEKECKIELEALKLSPEELAEKQKEINAKFAEFSTAYDGISDEFKSDLDDLRKDFLNEVTGKLLDLKEENAKKIERAESIDELQNIAKYLADRSSLDIESIVKEASKHVSESILSLREKYNANMDASFKKYLSSNGILNGFVFDQCWCKNLSGNIVKTLDYIITVIVMPGGAVGDIILRFIAGKIPGIRSITPEAMARGGIRRQFISNYRAFIDDTISEITTQSENAFTEAGNDICSAFEDSIKETESTANGAFDSAAENSKNPERTAQLEKAISELETVKNEL